MIQKIAHQFPWEHEQKRPIRMHLSSQASRIWIFLSDVQTLGLMKRCQLSSPPFSFFSSCCWILWLFDIIVINSGAVLTFFSIMKEEAVEELFLEDFNCQSQKHGCQWLSCWVFYINTWLLSSLTSSQLQVSVHCCVAFKRAEGEHDVWFLLVGCLPRKQRRKMITTNLIRLLSNNPSKRDMQDVART